jgi:hypothetical protein
MDDHYHLLLETPQANLSRAIRHLNGVYTQRFNRCHTRVGHLFQGRFTSILVEKETYLLELCRYLVLNPIRAGVVVHPGEWPWSSYRATVGETATPAWLTVDWLLGQFGKPWSRARAAYRQFVEDGIRRPAQPWAHLKSQIYLGSDAFLKIAQDRCKETDEIEIPRLQRRPGVPSLDALLVQVARSYGETVNELTARTRRPSEARQVGIYLARRVVGTDLKTIAQRFGVGYTTVSRRVGAVAKRIDIDKRLSGRVNAILDGKVKT